MPQPRDNKGARKRYWGTSAFAGALILIMPLVVFLRYQAYGLRELESLACVLLFAVIGASFGLLMETFGGWGRALLYAVLITLLVDIQSDAVVRFWLLWGVFAGSLGVALLLRRQLPFWGPRILIVMCVVSIAGPASRSDIGVREFSSASPGEPHLPVVVHLILDGQIGVEGIPEEFDTDGSHARGLRDLYQERGFRVFGRAYSRFYNSYNSIPGLLNFEAPTVHRQLIRREGTNWALKKNEYFDFMAEQGFAIRVFQSRYLDFCGENERGNIDWCWTFDPERLNAIQGTPLRVSQKMRVILGVYARLSSIATQLDAPVSQVTPIATLPIFDFIQSEVSQAQPGTLFFAHLLLPHSPYGLTADCDVLPDPDAWLMSHVKDMLPRRNTDDSRAERYPLYLDQMQCVMQRVGAFLEALERTPGADNMVVIVHGDHGSRLDQGPPTMLYRKDLSLTDYVDAFSTLFVVKHPDLEPGYDRRLLPVEMLLESVVRDRYIPEGDTWGGPPEVLLLHGTNLVLRPLPAFERSLEPGH